MERSATREIFYSTIARMAYFSALGYHPRARRCRFRSPVTAMLERWLATSVDARPNGRKRPPPTAQNVEGMGRHATSS